MEWHRHYVEEAVSYVDAVLKDLLPAGPDDKEPPPDWPHWQSAHRLMQARLELRYFLNDPPE